jgi:hypothetical protein
LRTSKQSKPSAARLVAAFVLLTLAATLFVVAAFLVWIPLGLVVLAAASLGLACLVLFL